MKKTLLAVLLTSSLALTACFETAGNKELIGGGSGALLGGLAGSQLGGGSGRLWTTGAGVLVGALIGSEIGSSLDKADMVYADQANARAYNAPVGQPISWNNPDTGNYGTVTPTRDGRTSDGRTCREFKQTIYVDGKSETAYGQACRNSDGTWQIQN